MSLLSTCSRLWCGALLNGGGSSGQTLYWEGCLDQQFHIPGPQAAVGVRDQIAVCYQLVAISEVPDVVNGSSGFEVATGVMELDFKDHVLTTKENIVRLVDRCLLGDADCYRDLI